MFYATSSGARPCAQSFTPAKPVDITQGAGCVPDTPVFHALVIIPAMADLAREIAERHGITVSELRGYSRKPKYVRPRQEFMWEARRFRLSDGKWRFSLPQIGRFLGSRDHTTVLHGVKKHAARRREMLLAVVRAEAELSVSIHGGE